MQKKRRGPATRLLASLGEDAHIALEQLVMAKLGGSVFLPRVLRLALLSAAGSDVRSAPGFGFRFAGRPRNLTLSRDVYLNQGVFIEAIAPVTIGAGSSLGMDCVILTSHHAPDGAGSWTHEPVGRPVTLGERVWVGARALLLPGCTIESDVVIAAGAVVRGHCEAHGLYAGVPARRVRELG